MPAQTPIDRTSLTMTLEERYASQRAGGAYDAKNVRNQPIDFGQQDKTFQTDKFDPTDDFNEKALNFSDSIGVSRKKYKP